ncbi:hypothetical protein K501DRAFT_22352 [Backusella circina FSU 941]|nr:hypothetical protein K501DRAFT_22352 [Backusella circina FSU 941]
MSTLRQLEKGSSNPRRRSRSLSDMEQFTLPLAQIGEHDLSLGQLNAMEEWQKTMADVENITGSSMSDLGSSAMTSNEGDVIEEPVVSANSSPPSSSHQKANYRVSTLGEMDFYQYQQQQQQIAFHNMQMQQAMQMAQIQQYQQAMQMQQQMMTNYDPRNANNRQSAMDLMIQMEQEKSASRKTNKKKPINPSNVSLNDGLLSRVPEQRQHNMSFQGQMMSKKTRTSKSDHNLRETRNRSSHRPPSGMAMYYDNARAGSSMGMDPRMYPQMGRSESPMPVVSMSTPLQPMMGQYLSPNRGRSRQSQQPMMQPMMAQSRSTGRSSHMPSSRQSTNWGSKNTERIR